MQERILEEFVFMALLVTEKGNAVKRLCGRNVRNTFFLRANSAARSSRSLLFLYQKRLFRTRKGDKERNERPQSSFLPGNTEGAYTPR